ALAFQHGAGNLAQAATIERHRLLRAGDGNLAHAVIMRGNRAKEKRASCHPSPSPEDGLTESSAVGFGPLADTAGPSPGDGLGWTHPAGIRSTSRAVPRSLRATRAVSTVALCPSTSPARAW